MNTELRNKINGIADKIREEFEISSPIDIIDDIVNTLGGKVIYNPIIEQGADAMVERDGESFIISVNSDHNITRQRFSIAHEIGHLFLHMGYLMDREQWEKNDKHLRKLSGEMEYQAHEFAAAFLMPKKEFVDIMVKSYNGQNAYNMGDVAAYFNVSVEAAINRGRWLGLLAWG